MTHIKSCKFYEKQLELLHELSQLQDVRSITKIKLFLYTNNENSEIENFLININNKSSMKYELHKELFYQNL